jgi:hypothetical protein
MMLQVPPLVKARQARANALAREGMRLWGIDQRDNFAWSIFYNECENYLKMIGFIDNKRHALARVYEQAAERVERLKKVI